jgi:hypothetical protein
MQPIVFVVLILIALVLLYFALLRPWQLRWGLPTRKLDALCLGMKLWAILPSMLLGQ